MSDKVELSSKGRADLSTALSAPVAFGAFGSDLIVEPTRPQTQNPGLSPGVGWNHDPPESLSQETPGRRFRNMNNPSAPLVTMIVPLSKNG